MSKDTFSTAVLQKEIFQNKISHGFNTTDVNFEFLMLYGEVAEAYDAYRKGKEDFPYELADIGIYLMSVAEMNGIDLGEAIAEKMKINKNRKYIKNENGVLIKENDTND